MNILLVNHYAGSPKYGMEYRPYYLAREWVKQGHSVKIVASSESHLHQTPPIINGITAEEKIDGIKYLWLKTPSYRGNSIRRILNMLSFGRQLFSMNSIILDGFTPDIIIASSPHPFIFRGAKHLANKAEAKLVFEVRDLWPLSLKELLGMSSFHPLIALMQHEENYAYKHADKVASLLPKALNHMSEHGLDSNKFMYTPNGIVVDEWDDTTPLPSEHCNKINQFKSKYKFLVGYSGTHGKPNALSFLLNAAKLIEEKNIGFVLIGDGLEKQGLRKQVNTLMLKNVLFLDSVNKISIPFFLRQMDILYVASENCSLYRFGISVNKIFEYMISEKPILQSIKAGNDPIAEAGCGISCPPESPQEIAKAIMTLKKLSKEELASMGKAGKRYVEKNHDYTVLARKYLEQIV